MAPPSREAPVHVAKRGKNESNNKNQSSKNPRRVSSGVAPRRVSDSLRQLSPDAVRLLRESYTLMDSDGTGTVSRETLRDMLVSLGNCNVGDAELSAMLDRTGEPIAFGSFLAVMAELINELPGREELEMMFEAFQRPDGSIDDTALRQAMRQQGLSEPEINSVYRRFQKATKTGHTLDMKAFVNIMSI